MSAIHHTMMSGGYGKEIPYVLFGNSCGVDTGILPSYDFRWEFGMKFVSSCGNSVLGTMGGNDNNDFRFFYDKPMYFDAGYRRNSLNWSSSIQEWHDYIISNDKAIMDEEEKSITIPSSIVIPFNIMIGKDNSPRWQEQNNGVLGNDAIFYLKYFRMFNNGEIVRDYHAWIDGKGNPCLFEKVENKEVYAYTEMPIAQEI